MEETRIEKILRKKTSRRNVLKGLGGAGLGLTFGAAIGTLIGKTVAEEGIKLEEDLFPSDKLYNQEVSGEQREIILEEVAGNWPILREKPNLAKEVGRIKPGTKAVGIEVFGEEYPSNLPSGKTTDPRDPEHTYGIWVKLEEKVPIYDDEKNPKFYGQGTQKMAKGFVAENFVTFLPKEDSSSP